MKDAKTEVKFFTVPDWKKEEAYLRDQHRQGWEFVRVDRLCLYHFRRCEPADVVYQLDYNEESTKNRDGYVRMFEDCGWEYLQNFFGYSYFRKPAAQMGDAEEEIFCDDESRLDMIRRVYNGRMVPLLLVFFAVIVPQMVSQVTRAQGGDPIDILVLVLLCVFFVLYLVLFASFARAYRDCREGME
jgi:hypothetical protein